ncbi:transcriptional regulator CynR [Pseudomonas sp. FW306-02-F02-AA]|uniref:Transcriptional regulator n=1 Tax=Pseudomonas fluorescens TaxID=294 RepID=A0A0N7H0D7_PSEFL|nr:MULTISPECIES: transcriptional regulator CynR [Pseudomonas]ALI02852.1 transcriptional regulator [Pseudomonas fluorescens]PMZ04284.1 transcriptional regulator CynR [Pseudomonas sp. FW306-02-F02-AB]PMZ10632.1 transcriptional regulator CynR [Pseudomonas sp. FW306-02-H06C]PMZ16026.1 transcriptional regulator CynR [Pseudomonas sp. FW306-02-F02-AA]PMZ21954.1 transcriptional regulator CynR [Pseudomonas sp. FW306-02-F08-AA]
MLLRHIRYLLAVAEHRNFTRAAEALHVSQPTLSQQIKQLEDVLGAPLFDRSGRTVRLTDAGEAYVRYARLALQDLEAAKRAMHDVQDLTRGSLRLAMTPTFTAYLIGPLLARFNSLYPGLTLSVEEMTQDQIEAALAEDRLDLGIAFTGSHLADIDSQTLFAETLSLVVSEAHPRFVRQQALDAQALGQQSLVLLSGDFATRQHIDLYCRQQGIAPRIVIEANSISAIVEIVRRGHLATILPEAITHALPGLRPLALQPALPQRTVALLSRKGAYRSAASEAFRVLVSVQ